ncbi:unnamed protein product [Rotaria socialis]|uniref:Pre-mRNA polyadenylation factor Fip1 domain-containing protein n=1 Tax=Rotaria socialis TaxID=392032 RepID=A0A817U7P3_9BILA|nr:unnamed protein product [Rotaria socialis]CAF3506123.1 unnamed protein product [Rotaria socialis]CAF3754182.1 unnamed protein product [Rotaria socialis]
MSTVMIDEISSTNGLIIGTDNTITEAVANSEDEDTWSFDNNTIAPSIDEITTQGINAREKLTAKPIIGDQFDDSDDDGDEIEVIIRNYESETSNFQTNREKARGMLSGSSTAIPPKLSAVRGVDCDAQGVINGQPTCEYDIMNGDKPWKKPGADITDYFNYGFTEEIWAQYCDRHRRLRNDTAAVRNNNTHFPTMLPGHPSMIHPMNSHQFMMINKPMNMQMMQHPMNSARIPDGKIDVIGATDKTTRRSTFDTQNSYEQPSYFSGSQFLGDQSPNGLTIGDRLSAQSTANSPLPSHGAHSGNTHHMPTMNMYRLPMMPLPRGMPFRSQFGPMHVHCGPQFLPHGPVVGMRGERPPQTFFVPHRSQQPWDKSGVPLVHGFPPRPFPSQMTTPETNMIGQTPSSRSPTPENRSVHSPTPEENRTSAIDNEKASKDNRFNERYRDDQDRDNNSTIHRRSPAKEHSSLSYHSRHRSREHEYERPKNDRKSSRDRDDKYEQTRKRTQREDSDRYSRDDEESTRNRRSSNRTPTKKGSSPSKSNVITSSQSSQPSNDGTTNSSQLSSPTANRSHRDNSERSSSRHSHHKKSSKRSQPDSDDQRNSTYDRKRSKDK